MQRVKLEETKPVRLAYVEHMGSYDKIPFPQYMEKLYGWAKEKHIRPGLFSIGLYYDSDRIASEKRRSEIGIPIYGEAEPEGDIKVKDLPAMQVATISHKAPSSEYPKTYETLSRWIVENGYEWAGPSIETYTRRPRTIGGRTIVYAKVKAPIRKKQPTRE